MTKDKIETLATDQMRARNDGACAWVPTSKRMPAPNESRNGYFWCWGPEYDTPVLLEVYGYESLELLGITHWRPAKPPKKPLIG